MDQNRLMVRLIGSSIPFKDLNRMAYGELYKGTFKKYRNTANRQPELSDNMKARDFLTQKFDIFLSEV